MNRKTKRILYAIAAVAAVVIIGIALLVRYANQLIKRELENFMGKDFSVELVQLSWGSVEAQGIKFISDDQDITAHIDKMLIKADFLGLIKKQYTVSKLVLEKPIIKIKITRDGKIKHPFNITRRGMEKRDTVPEKPRVQKEKTAFELRRLIINDGNIQVIDSRLPAQDSKIAIKNLNLQFGVIHFPLKNEDSDFDISANFDSRLLSGSLKTKGSINLITRAVKASLNGQQVKSIGGNFFKADYISFNAVSKGVGMPLILRDVIIKRPFVRVETVADGKWINPFTSSVAATKKEKTEDIIKETKKEMKTPITIKDLKIIDGEVLYLDGKVSKPPHPIRVNTLNMNLSEITVPFADKVSAYSISAYVLGKNSTGLLNSKGNINFKTIDTAAILEMRNLDLVGFKPYFQKKSSVDITKGFFNLDLDVTVRSRMLRASGKALIKDLQFAKGKSMGDKFIGVPSGLVLNLLKTSNNEIPLDFVIEGDVKDPKFNITESLVKSLSNSLAKKLGVSSMLELGEGIVTHGSKTVKDVTKSAEKEIKGIEEVFRGFFKR